MRQFLFITSTLSLSATLIFTGYFYDNSYLLLSWLGYSFLVTGLGYLGLGAKIYGKQNSGKIALWAWLIHLPFFLYTWSVWYLLQKLLREPAYDFVTEDILIGRRLLPFDTPPQVNHVVDLAAEFFETKVFANHPNYISLAALDGDIPESSALQSALQNTKSGTVFVHCAQGHGRSGLFALLLLAHRGEITDYDAAERMLRQARPGISLTGKQIQFAKTYLASMKSLH